MLLGKGSAALRRDELRVKVMFFVSHEYKMLRFHKNKQTNVRVSPFPISSNRLKHTRNHDQSLVRELEFAVYHACDKAINIFLHSERNNS